MDQNLWFLFFVEKPKPKPGLNPIETPIICALVFFLFDCEIFVLLSVIIGTVLLSVWRLLLSMWLFYYSLLIICFMAEAWDYLYCFSVDYLFCGCCSAFAICWSIVSLLSAYCLFFQLYCLSMLFLWQNLFLKSFIFRASDYSYLPLYNMSVPKLETDKFDCKSDFVMWRRKMKTVLDQNKIERAICTPDKYPKSLTGKILAEKLCDAHSCLK